LAGLLTCPSLPPSHLEKDSGMIGRPLCGLTAAGTVADFHGIPLTKAGAKLDIFCIFAPTLI